MYFIYAKWNSDGNDQSDDKIKIEKDVIGATLAVWVYLIENHMIVKAHESTVINDISYGNWERNSQMLQITFYCCFRVSLNSWECLRERTRSLWKICSFKMFLLKDKIMPEITLLVSWQNYSRFWWKTLFIYFFIYLFIYLTYLSLTSLGS